MSLHVLRDENDVGGIGRLSLQNLLKRLVILQTIVDLALWDNQEFEQYISEAFLMYRILNDR